MTLTKHQSLLLLNQLLLLPQPPVELRRSVCTFFILLVFVLSAFKTMFLIFTHVDALA